MQKLLYFHTYLTYVSTCHSAFNQGVPVELFIQALTIVGIYCDIPVRTCAVIVYDEYIASYCNSIPLSIAVPQHTNYDSTTYAYPDNLTNLSKET